MSAIGASDRLILIGAILLTIAADASTANAQRAGRIQRALDQPIRLELKEVPLAKAAQQISQRSEIDIQVANETFALLPYAKGTRVTVTFEGCSVRQGLETLCGQLALDFETTADGLRIIPSAPLRRIGRRAQWPEIGTISELINTRWLANGQEFLALRDRIQFHTDMATNPIDWNALASAIGKVGGGDADQVLSAACHALSCTWYAWDESIVVLPRTEQLKRRLAMPVSIESARKPLSDALAALSRQIDASIYLDPSAATHTPQSIRQNFTLIAEGVSAVDALNQIALATGLGYRIDDGAITFYSEGTAPTANRTSRRNDRIVGKVISPSSDGKYTYEFFIRESDLTPEENAHRQAKVRDAVESMKRDLTP